MKLIIANPSNLNQFYIIDYSEDMTLAWLSTQDGEGMECDAQELFDIVDEYFQDNM